MTYKQRAGRVKLPEGKRIAVALGCDFDAMCIWDGSYHRWTPAYQSRGEFGAEVAVQRLLALFDKHKIKTTWCIPGHSVETFPEACKDVLAAGHELAHHGYMHENPTEVDREREKEVLVRGLEALNGLGAEVKGYRSPYWDFSDHTLDLLEELGFLWDSSLMGNDFHPYYPRKVKQPERVQHGSHEVGSVASSFEPESRVLEIPVSWYLDDFPAMEFIIGANEGMRGVGDTRQRWQAIFDYGVDNLEGGVYPLTTHPQTIGRAHNIQMLDDLLSYMKERGAAFMTLSEVAAATVI